MGQHDGGLQPPDNDPRLPVVLAALQRRLGHQLPQASSGFAAHMSRPPHGLAWLAQALASALQPNNHNRDAGAACTVMEIEAIQALGRLVGWPAAMGHLCSGGTVANLEALWVLRERGTGGSVVLATDQAHYAHARNARLLGLRLDVVAADAAGRWDVPALAQRLAQGDVGTVIATVGTTALGAVDDLAAIVALQQVHGFQLQVDAAYGGYHGLAAGLPDAVRAAFEAMSQADAVVIDPHKHGLQPLGCAAVLYRDAAVREVFAHEAPYCYFDEAGHGEGRGPSDGPGVHHLGQLGLECSRAGATAAALWATLQWVPLTPHGRFAASLGQGVAAAQRWHAWLRHDASWVAGPAPALDIVTWVPVGPSWPAMSRRARAVREQAARRGLHLGLVQLPARLFGPAAATDAVTALRAVWMKPISDAELAHWWAMLGEANGAAGEAGSMA